MCGGGFGTHCIVHPLGYSNIYYCMCRRRCRRPGTFHPLSSQAATRIHFVFAVAAVLRSQCPHSLATIVGTVHRCCHCRRPLPMSPHAKRNKICAINLFRLTEHSNVSVYYYHIPYRNMDGNGISEIRMVPASGRQMYVGVFAWGVCLCAPFCSDMCIYVCVYYAAASICTWSADGRLDDRRPQVIFSTVPAKWNCGVAVSVAAGFVVGDGQPGMGMVQLSWDSVGTPLLFRRRRCRRRCGTVVAHTQPFSSSLSSVVVDSFRVMSFT